VKNNWSKVKACARWGALLAFALCGATQAQVGQNPYSYSRITSFTYDPNTGFPATQTVEPNNAANCSVTSYGYDGNGNRTSVTVANCAAPPAGASFLTHAATQSYNAPATQTINVGNNAGVVSAVPVSYPSGLFPTATGSVASTSVNLSEAQQYDPRFGAVTQLVGANGVTSNWVIDDFGRTVKESLPDGTSVVRYYCVIGQALDTSANSPGCPTPGTGEAPADAVAFVHSEARDSSGSKMGAFTRSYTDKLGREIRTVTESFDGSAQPAARAGAIVARDTVYSPFGVKLIETQPYFLASVSSTVAGSNDVGARLTSYDALGRPTTVYVSDPNGQAGTQTFGSYGSRTAARTSYHYSGLTVTVTNDKNQTKTEEKNPIGEVIRITDATGAQLAHQYDAFGNLIATKDALQNTISVAFDIRGHKLQLNDPDLGLVVYCYDAFGQLVATQNANMRGSGSSACPTAPNNGSAAISVATWTTYAYDQLGRLVDRVEPENRSTWSYDGCSMGKGKLCQVVNSNGSTRVVTYDGLGRPINSLTTLAGVSAGASQVE